MNAYMRIRRQNKMSREELAERMQIPVRLVVAYERAKHPVPTLHYHRNFMAIFNVTEEELRDCKS